MRSLSKRLIRKSAVGVLIALVAGCLSVSGLAQSRDATKPVPNTFAAVSIRLWRKGDIPVGPSNKTVFRNPAGVHIFFATLRDMVCYAYGIDFFQLSGGPRWVYGWPGPSQARYVLNAATSSPATEEQERAMLRESLAERFGLKLKREDLPTKVLALVVARGGPDLGKRNPGDVKIYSTKSPNGVYSWHFPTTADLVNKFNRFGIAKVLGRPLVDETGLSGSYDIVVSLRLESQPDGSHILQMRGLPAALRPLGLELKPETETFPIYTVENVHRPNRN